MRKNYCHHHCRYCLKQCLLFDRSPSLDEKKLSSTKRLKATTLSSTPRPKKAAAFAIMAAASAILKKTFCLRLHALLSLGKQLATTPVSHHAGKALLEAVVKAALLSCYTQLFCAFFKPIYRPAAEAFLATRLL